MVRSPALRRLASVLMIILVLDLTAAATSYVTHRDAAPALPDFRTIGDTTTVSQPPDLSALVELATWPDPGPVVDPPPSDLSQTQQPDVAAVAAIMGMERTRGALRPADRAHLRGLVLSLDQGFVVHPRPRAPGLRRLGVSARTQGIVLSALSKAYAATGQRRWKDAADQVFLTFFRIRDVPDDSGRLPDRWTGFIDPLQHLWFESYPELDKPSQLLAGHLWATLGLAEYHAIATGDYRRAARRLVLGGAATAAYFSGIVRRPYLASRVSPATEERSLATHRLMTAQLQALYEVTEQEVFAERAGQFLADSALAEFMTEPNLRLRRGVNVDQLLPTGSLAPNAPTNADRALRFALTALDQGETAAAAETAEEIWRTTRNGWILHAGPMPFSSLGAGTDWHSAVTQGLLLWTLVRLHEETQDPAWADRADEVFQTFTRVRGYRANGPAAPANWVTTVGDDVGYGNLWFAAEAPAGVEVAPVRHHVLAHTTAVLALYRYWSLTQDPVAQRLVEGGLSTVKSRLPDIQLSGRRLQVDLTHGTGSQAEQRALAETLQVLDRIAPSMNLAKATTGFEENHP